MTDGSWHFFIPLEEALPVQDKYHVRKFASGFIKNLDQTIRYRPDDILMIFHQRTVACNPFPQINAASEALYGRSVSSSRSRSSKFPESDAMLAVTVVEIIVNKRMFNENGKERLEVDGREISITKSFDFALNQLNTWIKAFALLRACPVVLVTKESLPYVVPFAKGLLEPSDLDVSRLPKVTPEGVLKLHSNIPALNEPPIPAERLETWMDSALVNSSIPGPFFSFHDFRNDAMYAHHRAGNYRVAVILYASACESLLDELLQHMLWEGGARPNEAYREFFDRSRNARRSLGIVALVKKKIHPKLTATEAREPLPEQLTNWIEKVAMLRNKVIHNGYDPHLGDIEKCVKAAEALSLYLSDRIFDKRDDYPITALALLGEEGLKRRGDWDRFNRLETNIEELHLRLFTFRLWSRHLAVFRQYTDLLNSPADPIDGVMYLIKYSSGEERIYAVHFTKAVATKIPFELAAKSEVYRRLKKFAVEENGFHMDPKIIINNDAGGFLLPEGARWDQCSYEVIPGQSCQFNVLSNHIGYQARFG